MAALMAAVAAASTAFSTLHLSKPNITLTCATHRRLCTLISSSLSSSPSTASTPTKFNITFATPKPNPKPKHQTLPEPEKTLTPDSDNDSANELGYQLFIPWIVRDENGDLTLQSTPPARLLQEMANAKTNKKKKKEKDTKIKSPASSTEPKLSKAARRFYNEKFRDPPQRLIKVLAAAGVASRRSSEELIFGGKVTVNGSVCDTPRTRVDAARDAIYVNGKRLSRKLPPKVYLALNKPKGIRETQVYRNRDCLAFTVGRLDVATTGLIIVTNDDGPVNKQQLIAISEGTVIEGAHCTPDIVELLPQQADISRPQIRIVVHEGRHHEVRELVKHAGLQIHALKRVRIGGFRLPSDLGIGKLVELKQANLRALGWKS